MQNKTDFTLSAYKQLISTLQAQGYFFQTFKGFIQNPKEKVLILRHDVDRLPENALKMARMEDNAGIKASYYFRIVKKSYDENIIKKIAEMGHEIGYHYENLSEINCLAQRRPSTISRTYGVNKGAKKDKRTENRIEHRENRKEELFELALEDFERNLEKFRKIYPVKTICMHGSPLSKWDNRDLWKRYDYRDYGIIAEPYFDLDFDEVFYLTDTGRRWDGAAVSVRDKVNSGTKDGFAPRRQVAKITAQNSKMKAQKWPKFHSTFDIIEVVEAGIFPDKAMLTVHPQRWTDNPLAWTKELFWQNCKNVNKKGMISRKDAKPQRII